MRTPASPGRLQDTSEPVSLILVAVVESEWKVGGSFGSSDGVAG